MGELNLIMDKSKQIYSIGVTSKLPHTAVLMYSFFGLVFCSAAIYQYATRGRFDFISSAFGLGFLVFGMLAYIRNKRLNLNC
ncbi:hypothetical protein [Methylogaea oryzae]|uniref:hypothetical protein n=1 Tax=Methylogaea oryzae TaxID=1295382 RepID=UPI0006D108ED|nr:hypothetical protein [Methylogaea oryzae]